jgi:hypothetical protein
MLTEIFVGKMMTYLDFALKIFHQSQNKAKRKWRKIYVVRWQMLIIV